MRIVVTRNEAILLAAFAALCALALFAPALAQPAHLHDFADQRGLWGVPRALDVLSNIPFAIAGLWGLAVLKRAPKAAAFDAQRACARLFFIGLLFTAVGSSVYHLAPDDLGLALDRGTMGVAFAGLLGMASAARVSERAGAVMAACLLVLAPVSVAVWFFTGNVLPWAVVQFGGIALLLLVLAFGAARSDSVPVRWSLVLLAYALAKLLEANDHAILEATGHVSGHTLKHVAAAFAAWPVIAALAPAASGQNARETTVKSA
jgi:hypothetical protein